MADQQRDVIEVLTQDHREVERIFAELEGLTGADTRARRQDLVEQVTIELVKHSVAEEAEVYPAVRAKVSEAAAQRALGEHAEAEQTMKRLESMTPGDPGFDTELATLMREIRQHVAEEEGQMFADMRRVFSPEELVELGRKVEAVKKLAPTRPHPAAPDTPPGETILRPAAGLLDRLRDAVTGRGHSGSAGSPTR
ncbi:hemerythrin domain-containing protein [Rhodococcus opacus]|uniref:Hemerythrin n=1 Tax=Rhodococcus opacus TaxID=37919 RepID=A0A2S8IXL3_RHOOP|nr:hemerythrin domain-containing protein [Rhodococcus opacus]PQP19544.1 hemerythrin [Rhodococcus opacus]